MYAIGSITGPHPFPLIVSYFQSVIGKEARSQMLNLTDGLPDYAIACVGGGSNAIGIFSGFLNDKNVKLVGVEPLGKGKDIGDNASSINFGMQTVEHGFRSLFLQKNGKLADAYSIASGLDYPGVGPQHAYLSKMHRVSYETIGDKECIEAFHELSKMEGIIPALESSHAVAYGLKLAKTLKSNSKVLINLSGRGDKDIDFVLNTYGVV